MKLAAFFANTTVPKYLKYRSKNQAPVINVT